MGIVIEVRENKVSFTKIRKDKLQRYINGVLLNRPDSRLYLKKKDDLKDNIIVIDLKE